jgi:hypothetical protein
LNFKSKEKSKPDGAAPVGLQMGVQLGTKSTADADGPLDDRVALPSLLPCPLLTPDDLLSAY